MGDCVGWLAGPRAVDAECRAGVAVSRGRGVGRRRTRGLVVPGQREARELQLDSILRSAQQRSNRVDLHRDKDFHR